MLLQVRQYPVKDAKEKTDESIGLLPDLELDENTESESDQLQPPKQVKMKRKSGSSEVLDVPNQYIEEHFPCEMNSYCS